MGGWTSRCISCRYDMKASREQVIYNIKLILCPLRSKYFFQLPYLSSSPPPPPPPPPPFPSPRPSPSPNHIPKNLPHRRIHNLKLLSPRILFIILDTNPHTLRLLEIQLHSLISPILRIARTRQHGRAAIQIRISVIKIEFTIRGMSCGVQ